MTTNLRREAGSRNQTRTLTWLVLLTLLLTSTLTVMDASTVAPALPDMERYFSATANAEILTRLVVSVPPLFLAVSAIFAGTLVDRVGRRPVLIWSVVLFGLAGTSGAFLDSLYAILAGRVLLGVALAGVMTAATTLIADYYSGEERSRVYGMQAAFMGLGGVVFAILGGFLAEIDWRVPFVVYLSAILLVPLIALRLWEPDRRPDEASGGAGTDDAGAHGEGLGQVIFLLVPLAILGMVVFNVALTQLPFLLDDAFGLGASGSGLSLGLLALFQFVAAMSYGRISGRLGLVPVALASFVLLGAGYALVGFAGNLPVALVGLVLSGCGGGFLIPTLTNWASSVAPEATKGRILGGLMGAVFFGQFLSPVLSQPVASAYGFGAVFVAAAGLSAALAVFVVATRRYAIPNKPTAKTEI